MEIEPLLKLWQHRYYKYTHILSAHILGKYAVFYFWIKKRFKLRARPLIAIIRTEHFGDIVAAEPISRLVRSRFPDGYIVWFVKPAFKELVAFNPEINEVYEEFCVSERTVILNSNVFDEVFELQFRNNNECKLCQTFRENPVSIERNINVTNYLNYGNLLEVFAKCSGLIENEAAFPADDQPRLYMQQKHFRKIDLLHLPEQFIVIHCQSNYPPKDWPTASWVSLVAFLIVHYNFHIIEIGLSSDLNIKADRYLNYTGKLTLMDTAALISRAKFFIGLDSGPSHFANATGVPSIILMGALNNFLSYNPYSGGFGIEGDKALIIREVDKSCVELPVETVIEQLKQFIDAKL